MISPVVLTASEALCLCVPYLGEAKRLAVTANQSGGEKGARVFLYAGSQLGMNQRVEKEAKERMTERLDTQAAPWRHRNKCRICKSEKKKKKKRLQLHGGNRTRWNRRRLIGQTPTAAKKVQNRPGSACFICTTVWKII